MGNLILVPSLIAILIALTDAGTTAPWSSSRVLVPLIVGFAGLVAFHIYEATKYCLEPTIPMRLFTNRTTVTAYILTFIHTLDSIWIIYFLPVYFQAVLGSSPSRSGVQILPTVLILLPFAILGGLALTKSGRYRPFHHVGFALMTLGFGLFTLLKSSSSTAEWVIFQGVTAAGSGIILSTMLPAIQASLAETDSASSTATFAFIRSFGGIWGLTIPAVIFNNQFDHLAHQIVDPSVRAIFVNGQAYEHASRSFIYSFEEITRLQIIGVYTDALKVVWEVGIALCGVAFLLAFVEKEIKLRTDLETEYGMKKEVKEKIAVEAVA